MPDYKYTAIDKHSKKVIGTVTLDSPKHLYEYLINKEQYLLDYKIATKKKKSRYVFKDDELGEFSSQISAMLKSGLSVTEALLVLVKRTTKTSIRTVYQDIYKSMLKGLTLSEALNEQGKTFPKMLINMYRLGEESGRLEEVAKKVGIKYTSQHQTRSKIKSELLYPKILGIVTVGVVIFLFTIVMPKLFTLFEDIELPLPTKIIVSISNFMINRWYVIVTAIIIIIVLIKLISKNEMVRINIDRFKIKAPFIGNLNKTIYTSGFARTLSTLFLSGVSIDKALIICKDVIENEYIKSQFDNVVRKIQSGEPLAKSIEEIDGFDIKIVLAMNVGQESGTLTQMLERTADSYDEEAKTATSKIIGIIEPIIILLMAIIIGFIALSIMLPMMSIYNNVK